MYHGALMNDRGIEIMIRAIAATPGAVGVFIGNPVSLRYKASLIELVADLGIRERILFHCAVPHRDLHRFVGAADVCVSLIDGSCHKSYYYALPNKVFEAIQAEVPLIVSNYPEMSRIVNLYQIGIAVDSDNINSVVAAFNSMRTNKLQYKQYKSKLPYAKDMLCWEKEKYVLINSYREYIGQ